MDQYDLRTSRVDNAPKGSRFLAGLLSGTLVFTILILLSIGAGIVAYALIAASLPPPSELLSRASDFQTTRILDREGNLLYESIDPNAGRRTVVKLGDISPFLSQATIATEDENFYRHGGVDPFALLRALYYALREGDIVSGASTIPQQLVKRIYLTPERSLSRKLKEVVLSSEVSRRYDKDTILELYLNEVYYGNLAYGASAAAQTYFNKAPADLTLAEASLLAGLPQLPAYYDPYSYPDRAKNRQAVVLSLMVENGYISTAEADTAWLEALSYSPLRFELDAPHFTLFVREQLEELYGPDALYKSGLTVTTTLDPKLQELAEEIVADHVATLAANNASNGALVALRPGTGELLALVGSADFNDVEIDGQINMALAPRQPGSAIKPIVYLATFEQPDVPIEERWTPGTLVADIVEPFPDGANPPYVPTNYNHREHGMVTVHTALANSLNIPAVRALEAVGIPDFVAFTRRLGVTTLDRPDYGLSLSLGAGEIPLLELTNAYAAIANAGVYTAPVTIRNITDSQGDVLCDIDTDRPCQPGDDVDTQTIDPADAFLITDILSDNEARAIAFGPNSVLQLDRPTAVKTGTTNDVRDNLTVGYTPQLVTGVWVGNADNSAMRDLSGITGAGPIWNRFMTTALADEPVIAFTTPPSVQTYEVCADTGAQFGPACPQARVRYFAADRPPLPTELDLYQIISLDKESGRLATEFTPTGAVEEKIFKVYPEQYRRWAEEHGIPQPPVDESDAFTFGPELTIRQPVEGEVVQGILQVRGTANAPAFSIYELQYGVSHDPGAFSLPFSGPQESPILDGILGEWDVRTLDPGPHTLRLVVRDSYGTEYESRVRVFVAEPTPTPLPTSTNTQVPPTLTWTPTPTSSATLSTTPTSSPETTYTNEPTSLPTSAPPTDTPLPTLTPEPTLADVPTPSITPMPSATDRPSQTPTRSATLAPAATYTNIATIQVFPSATATHTADPTATPVAPSSLNTPQPVPSPPPPASP